MEGAQPKGMGGRGRLPPEASCSRSLTLGLTLRCPWFGVIAWTRFGPRASRLRIQARIGPSIQVNPS
ncbi:hypothetical protein FHS28_004248 [Roseateles terrae]|uniref:Uncharacterized protein n=1 Tax=Roseateles terrae TaxID=431060 RepID=A0ABR6GXJ5_9BURK|nr:hypothetical protein [Roseateles terrae]